jgi:hypothetical protein
VGGRLQGRRLGCTTRLGSTTPRKPKQVRSDRVGVAVSFAVLAAGLAVCTRLLQHGKMSTVRIHHNL